MPADKEQQETCSLIQHETVSILAHQLRTSLAASKWILKMFQDGDVGELTAEQRGFIDKAFSANERMIDLVSEMLEIAKVGETQNSLTLTAGSIVELIDDSLFNFTSESYKRGVEIIFLRPETDLPLIPFDWAKVRFVMQNLIENAIKYSDKGDRVVIAIEKHNDHEIEISVKDTGIGIPADEQPKIFERYFRADNAKKKEDMGTGLGLYTAKHIIEQHGGTMSFESKDGTGTTFFFTLPTGKKPHSIAGMV
jgi:signal transduction histidine kinase